MGLKQRKRKCITRVSGFQSSCSTGITISVLTMTSPPVVRLSRKSPPSPSVGSVQSQHTLLPARERAISPRLSSQTVLQGAPTKDISRRSDVNEPHEYSCSDIYGHGPFQRMILFCCVLSLVVLQCHSLAFKLIARDVDFWCKRPASLAHLSDDEWKKLGIPIDADGTYSRCEVYSDPLHNNRTVLACHAWEYESPFTTIVTQWDLVCNRAWLLMLANAVYMTGAMVAVPVMGIVSDRVGRRPVIGCAILALLFAGFGSCFATNFVLFVCVRFVVSACVSTVFVTTVILVFEVTTAGTRTLYTTVAVSLGVVIFNLLFDLLRQVKIAWRVMLLIIMALTTMLVSAFYIVEESPLWLLATSRFERAEECVLWAAKVNGERLDNVREEFAKLAEGTGESEITSPVRETPLVLLTSPALRARCIALFTCWFTVMLSYYGLSFTEVVRSARWAPIADAISLGPLTIILYFAMSKVGRKSVLVVVLLLLGGSLVVLTVTYSKDSFFFSNVALVIARGAAQMAVNANFIYTAELFPTVVRGAGVCGGYMMGRVGAATASAIAVSTMVRSDAAVVVLEALVLACQLGVTRLPDTFCKPLANTVKEMEDENLHQQLQSPNSGRASRPSIVSPRLQQERQRQFVTPQLATRQETGNRKSREVIRGT